MNTETCRSCDYAPAAGEPLNADGYCERCAAQNEPEGAKQMQLEHCKGTAGISEQTVETVEITQEELDAYGRGIFLAAAGCDWPVSEDGRSADNPDAANRSGAYCDYWMLVDE